MLSEHSVCFRDKHLNEVLLTVSLAVIRVVSYVRNSPFTRRPSAKLYNDMEAEHTALLYFLGDNSNSDGAVKILFIN
jgi:hypothetical protein